MILKISVIIPMYNVGDFIERCSRSLMEQTMNDIELIFVNDCSPDNSVGVLEKVLLDYPDSTKKVEIIHHANNLGLPSARNSGLKIASGEYVFHCDGDDYMEVSGLEQLYTLATKSKADIVYSDWYLTYDNSERYMSQRLDEPSTAMNYLKAILDGRLKYNVWNKLVKRELYFNNKITFPDGYGMGEDMTMIMLVASSNKVSYLPSAIYHYLRTNTNAFTNSGINKEKQQHFLFNVDRIVSFLHRRFGSQLNDYIDYFKLNLKFPFLISEHKESYKIWNELFKDSNKFIGKNPNESSKNVLLQKLALKKQYLLLKLYNVVIMRWVYNLIYN